MAKFVTFKDALVLDLDSITWAQKVGDGVRINVGGQVFEVTSGVEELWRLLFAQLRPADLSASKGNALPTAGHFMVDSGPS